VSKQNLGKERHFFLEENSKVIYCVEYLPEDRTNKNYGVILCKPMWGERIRTHRIFTHLARMLSSEGFTVITFDYYGDGNSGGETKDLSYFSMVNDILSLYRYVDKKYQVNRFALIGLLVGANIAIDAEPKFHKLNKMILFEPLLNPIDRIKKALRANLSSQMVVHKKTIKNRDALIQDLRNDIPVNIDGFIIGKKLWESFEQASPLKIESDFPGSVSVYSMVDKGRKGTDYSELAQSFSNCNFQTIEKEFIWTDWKYYIPKPPIFINAVRSELLNNH